MKNYFDTPALITAAIFFLLFIVLFCNSAHATQPNVPPPFQDGGDADARARSDADARASASNRTKVDVVSVGIGQGGDARSRSYSEGGDAAAYQGQLQGQTAASDQSQSAVNEQGQSQSADNNGNSQDVTVNNNHNEAENYRPAASTPATVIGNTTAACRSFIGISGSSVSGGGGIGFPVTDRDCKFMTLAQGAFNQGNDALGWNLYCTAPSIVKQIGRGACILAAGEAIMPKPEPDGYLRVKN